MSFFNVFCFIESGFVNDIKNVYLNKCISLFGWDIVYRIKNIQFVPSPEKLAFSTDAAWSEQ